MLERCSQSGRKGSFIRKNIPARNRSEEIAFIAPQNDEKCVKVPIFLYDSGLHDESSGSWKYSVHDPEGKTSEEADWEDIGRIWVGKEIVGRNKRRWDSAPIFIFFLFQFFPLCVGNHIGVPREFRSCRRCQCQLDFAQSSHRILNNDRIIVLQVDHDIRGHRCTLCEQYKRLQ